MNIINILSLINPKERMDHTEGKNQYKNDVHQLETFKLNDYTHFAVECYIENNGQRKHKK